MKLFLILLGFFAITQVSSQITGTWYLDWRSQQSQCPPAAFTITGTGTAGYTIAYNYSSQVVNNNQNCTLLGISGNFSSLLIYNSSNGAYVDNHQQSLTYYPSNDTIWFNYNTSQFNSSLVLYDRTGSFLSQDLALGLILGFWTNPTCINSTTQAGCNQIVPGNMSIQNWGGVWSLNILFDASGDPLPGPDYVYSLQFDDQNQPFWSGDDLQLSYVLNSTTNQSTLIAVWVSTSTNTTWCFSYTRNVNYFPGIWQRDWQSTNEYKMPISIQILNIDNTYMTIESTYSTSTSQSVLSQYSPNRYMDQNQNSYAYDEATNTLLGVYTFGNETALYSPNGSYFSNSLFFGNWSNAQLVNQSDTDCCVPNYMNFTASSMVNSLDAMYAFTNNGLTGDCNGVQFSSVYTGQPTVTAPSSENLTYTMPYGQDNFVFTSNNDLSNPQIIATYSGLESCSFVMTPAVKHGSLISSVIFSILSGLFLIFMMI